jgi:hypothetical protein
MGGIVVHLELNSSGTSDVRELVDEGFNWCTVTYDLDAGDQRPGGLGLCRRRRNTAQQAMMRHFCFRVNISYIFGAF